MRINKIIQLRRYCGKGKWQKRVSRIGKIQEDDEVFQLINNPIAYLYNQLMENRIYL
jgi:hypothetical protein